MRLQSIDASRIPADLEEWYADTYSRIGEGRYQTLAYNAAHERERLNKTLGVLASIEERGSCLEVGCSEGIITRELVKLFGRVAALDISAQAIAVCPELPNVEYIRADIETEGLIGVFDVILLSDVLEHLRDPKAVIQKCAEHARWMVAVGPTTEPLNEANAFTPGLLECGQRPGDGTGHIWYMDREGFLSLFEGLRIERVVDGGEHHTVLLVRGKMSEQASVHELAVAVSVNVDNLLYVEDETEQDEQLDIITATLEEIAERTA